MTTTTPQIASADIVPADGRPDDRRAARAVALASSVPLVYVAVTVAVMVVHTLARGHLWRYEWMWAAYQYHFGVLLIGPVVCGVAAWSGGAIGAARWLTRPAADARLPLRTLAIAIAATVGAYLVAFVVPAVVVVSSGTTDSLRWSVPASFLPASTALAAYVAVGFAIGARRPGRLVPPIVAIVAFAVTMAGWIGGAEHLVRLGGASSSMVGLVPRPVVQVLQVVAYGALGVAAATWAIRRLAGGGLPSRVAVVVAGIAGAVAGGWLVATTTPLFDHPAVREVCVAGAPDGPRLCAPAAYEHPLRRMVPTIGPLIGRLEAAGAPLPADVHLGSAVDLFEADPSPSVLAAELSPMLGLGRCVTVTPSADEVYVSIWLALVVGDTDQTNNIRLDPDLPDALAGADVAAQDAWARDALVRVRAECSAAR